MRLKHLAIHGFKTFAPRTELRFGEGITAIVGPNGSGKSNVADAVRWVLGEQSLTNLRAKKTEDLIFAGSSNRAPVGMAEVSLTLDNSDRLIPLDFSEVTLTRRAYRSGENEYYINKSRVRLRDVLNIAAGLGQAYTVVGQGLVDAALSLRPEERRELFEEAAAIRGYFVQREDALRRLAKTEENVARVSDLATELEPQVRRLERQAKQAQEYRTLDEELHSHLETWYGARLMRGLTDLRRADESELQARRAVEERRGSVSEGQALLAGARRRVWECVNDVSALHEQCARAQSRHASQSQARAVLDERLSSAEALETTLARERADLDRMVADRQRQLRVLRAEEEERTAEVEELEATNLGVVEQLSKLEAQLREAQEAHKLKREMLGSLQKRSDELANRLASLAQQRLEHDRVASDGERVVAALREKVAAQEAVLQEKHGALLEAHEAVAQAEQEQQATAAALNGARNRLAAAESHRRDLQKRSDALASQIAALAGEQQASLYGGVRAVISAAREGRLEGVVGTVAELLRVPADLEVAIEAALGARLQEVVVARWSDAERAIGFLKQSGAGRATFLPLDTLRSAPPTSPPRAPGIVGVARDLVGYDPSIGPVAEALLSRLLIAKDLPSARGALSSMSANAPWTIATLEGEVVRAGGSITGGSNTRQGDARAHGRTILARERKRRELVALREGLEQEAQRSEGDLREASAALTVAERQLSAAQRAVEEGRRRETMAKMVHVEQQGSLARLQQELAWRLGLVNEARSQLQALSGAEVELNAQRSVVEAELPPVLSIVAELEEQIRDISGERSEVTRSTGEAQTRLAVLAEGMRNLRARKREIEVELGGHARRAAELQERRQRAAGDAAALRAEIKERERDLQQLSTHVAELEAKVEPSEKQVRELEAEVGRLESEHSTMQSALLECETRHSRAAVEREHAIGVLDSLWVETTEELGERAHTLIPQAITAGVGGGGPLQPGEVAHAWAQDWVELSKCVLSTGNMDVQSVSANGNGNGHGPGALDLSDFPALERRIYSLKSRLSRLGPVNPLAVEEFATLSERHDYLRRQLQDLTAAADKLRSVIAELDRAMREQFAATFAQVNQAFQHFFKTLFGGGTAQLELTNPEDFSSTGVEISAQPPGKRMQPLAALSGGERALTSAALLFALLRVRPVPFCVLDEVDAALDESNVTRFRSALLELGERTQFVVITHNRGTIEVANTLYGVSMAGDGTSKLLSLQVERGAGGPQ